MELEKQLESLEIKDTADKENFLQEIRKKISIIKYSLQIKEDKIKSMRQNLTGVLVKHKLMKQTVEKLEKEIKERDVIYKERIDYFKSQLLTVQEDLKDKDGLIDAFREQTSLLEAKLRSFGKEQGKTNVSNEEGLLLKAEIDKLKKLISKKDEKARELENRIRNLMKIEGEDKDIIIRIALKLGKYLPNIKIEDALEFIRDNFYIEEKSLDIKIKDFRERLVSRR